MYRLYVHAIEVPEPRSLDTLIRCLAGEMSGVGRWNGPSSRAGGAFCRVGLRHTEGYSVVVKEPRSCRRLSRAFFSRSQLYASTHG